MALSENLEGGGDGTAVPGSVPGRGGALSMQTSTKVWIGLAVLFAIFAPITAAHLLSGAITALTTFFSSLGLH